MGRSRRIRFGMEAAAEAEAAAAAAAEAEKKTAEALKMARGQSRKNGLGAEPTVSNPYVQHYVNDVKRNDYEAVAFQFLFSGMFTKTFGRSDRYKLFNAVCRYYPVSIDFNSAEWRRQTTDCTDNVLSHLKSIRKNPSLFRCLTSHDKTDPLSSVIAVLKKIDAVDSSLENFLTTNKQTLQENASSLRATILERISKLYTGSEDPAKEWMEKQISGAYTSELDKESASLSNLRVQPNGRSTDSWHASNLIEDFLDNVVKKKITVLVNKTEGDKSAVETIQSDVAYRRKAEKQEELAIADAIRCIHTIRKVYSDYYAALENGSKTIVNDFILKSVNKHYLDTGLKQLPANTEFLYIPSSEERVIEGSKDCLALFLWEMILERIETLSCHAYTVFNAIFLGCGKDVQTSTKRFMSAAIDECLSPLFKGDLYSNRDTQEAKLIKAHYELCGNLSQTKEMLTLISIPEFPKPETYDLKSLQDLLDHSLTGVDGAPVVRQLTSNPSFSSIELGVLKTGISNLLKNMDSPIPIPDCNKGSRSGKHGLVYYPNSMRDLIQTEIVSPYSDPKKRYRSFRSVVRASWQVEPTFYARFLMAGGLPAKIRASDNEKSFMRCFFCEMENPVACFISDKERADLKTKLMEGKSASVDAGNKDAEGGGAVVAAGLSRKELPTRRIGMSDRGDNVKSTFRVFEGDVIRHPKFHTRPQSARPGKQNIEKQHNRPKSASAASQRSKRGKGQ
jgi:hypothetical protein